MSRRSWNSTLDREKLHTYTQAVIALTEVVIQENNEDVDMYDLNDDGLFDGNENDGETSDSDSDDSDSDNSDNSDSSDSDSDDSDDSDNSDSSDSILDDSDNSDSSDSISVDSDGNDSDNSNNSNNSNNSDNSDSMDDESEDSDGSNNNDHYNNNNWLENGALDDNNDNYDNLMDDDYEFDIIDDDMMMVQDSGAAELLLVVLEHTIKQYNRVYNPIEDNKIVFAGKLGHRMMIHDFNESECISNFRFKQEDLVIIAHHLWPVISPFLGKNKMKIRLLDDYTAPFETCLLAYLFKMARPRRFINDMEKFFSLRKSHLSSIVQTFGDALYEVSIMYLQNPSIWHPRMPYYADLVYIRTGGMVGNIWGFIDATLRKTCRPFALQHLAYSGYKKCHGLKYQSIATPDGFVACIHGPFIGRQHDASVLDETGINHTLMTLMPRDGSNGPIYAVYGDSAYRQSYWIYCGFINPPRHSPEAAVNKILSGNRVSVEWSYGSVATKFSHLDFRQSQQVFKQKIGQQYMNCNFILNWSNCFYGSNASQKFRAKVLSFQEYLNLVPHPN